MQSEKRVYVLDFIPTEIDTSEPDAMNYKQLYGTY